MLQSEKKWVECDHWMQEQTVLYHEKYLQSVNNDVNNMPAILQGVYKTKPDLNNLWDECSEKGIWILGESIERRLN